MDPKFNMSSELPASNDWSSDFPALYKMLADQMVPNQTTSGESSVDNAAFDNPTVDLAALSQSSSENMGLGQTASAEWEFCGLDFDNALEQMTSNESSFDNAAFSESSSDNMAYYDTALDQAALSNMFLPDMLLEDNLDLAMNQTSYPDIDTAMNRAMAGSLSTQWDDDMPFRIRDESGNNLFLSSDGLQRQLTPPTEPVANTFKPPENLDEGQGGSFSFNDFPTSSSQAIDVAPSAPGTPGSSLSRSRSSSDALTPEQKKLALAQLDRMKDEKRYGMQRGTGRSVPCDICKTTFASKQALKSHIEAKELKLKEVCCPVCHKKLADNSALSRHRKKVHTPGAPLRCVNPGCSFTCDCFRPDHLDRHGKTCAYRPNGGLKALAFQ